MKLVKAIKLAQMGTSFLILKSMVEIIIAVLHLTDYISYIQLIVYIMEMVGFMLLYAFFDNMTDKLNNFKDK